MKVELQRLVLGDIACFINDAVKQCYFPILGGRSSAGSYSPREFRDFMNNLIVDYSDREMHVILDNLKTHKPKNGRWVGSHKNVYFHYTPTHASWLNQVEIWFSILTRKVLRGGNFASVKQLGKAIDDFMEAYNQDAPPFECAKVRVHSVPRKNNIANLCS